MIVIDGIKYYSTCDLRAKQKDLLEEADRREVLVKREGRIYSLQFKETVFDVRKRRYPTLSSIGDI